MGYIKEPKGIDLIIPPSTFTDKDIAEISEFIRIDKLKNKRSNKGACTKKVSKEPNQR
jgi:hypothetical protein